MALKFWELKNQKLSLSFVKIQCCQQRQQSDHLDFETLLNLQSLHFLVSSFWTPQESKSSLQIYFYCEEQYEKIHLWILHLTKILRSLPLMLGVSKYGLQRAFPLPLDLSTFWLASSYLTSTFSESLYILLLQFVKPTHGLTFH